jgi:hypothetical protein
LGFIREEEYLGWYIIVKNYLKILCDVIYFGSFFDIFVRLKSRVMRRMILCILFLLGVVCGWNTIGERLVSIENQMIERSEKSEAKQYVDPMILVLAEANRSADICTRTTNTLPTNLIRRQRCGRGCCENVSEVFKSTQKILFHHHLKSYHVLSQRFAAQQRAVGYYFYTLRKMII